MPTLELYKKDSCPFCQKVLRFIKNHGIEGITYRDIIDVPENQQKLIEQGGKNQVPCLFIDGKPLYESDDIISWLKEHLLSEASVGEEKPDEPGICNIF